ncbi:hypothetical protein [Planococcus sp. YIM B11945]|uniref:hypothetical protein n=1 Tax=Planococcus sp. YIM B11945 TaxID=3435410 RepID=UPI003D7CA84A
MMPSEPKKIASRSTIYLPIDFILTKPTTEINEQYKKLPLLAALTEDPAKFFKSYVSMRNHLIATKPYQIKINDDPRKILSRLKQKTGLNVSQLTELCFQL